VATVAQPTPRSRTGQKNLSVNGSEPPSSTDYLSIILQGLQTIKDGDFSVRLPVSWTGLAGKIADHFN
jgi:hypothetical protein